MTHLFLISPVTSAVTGCSSFPLRDNFSVSKPQWKSEYVLPWRDLLCFAHHFLCLIKCMIDSWLHQNHPGTLVLAWLLMSRLTSLWSCYIFRRATFMFEIWISISSLCAPFFLPVSSEQMREEEKSVPDSWFIVEKCTKRGRTFWVANHFFIRATLLTHLVVYYITNHVKQKSEEVFF